MWGWWWERSEELVVLWCGCSSREMRNWTSVKHTACCIYGYGSIEYHGNPISTKGCKCLKYGSCLWRALSLVGGGASRICTASASSQRSRGYNFDLHLSFRDCLKSPPSTYSTTIWNQRLHLHRRRQPHLQPPRYHGRPCSGSWPL